ncbi:MAG: hypothetical protein RJB13_187 [Pseudomonadota bacterium]
MMSETNGQEPWYAPSGKKKGSPASYSTTAHGDEQPSVGMFLTVLRSIFKLKFIIFALLLSVLSCYVGFRLTVGGHGLASATGFVCIFAGQFFALLLLLYFLGVELAKVAPVGQSGSATAALLQWFQGQFRADEGRKGPPAPELALLQFVSQVRSYATEKSFQNVRPSADKPLDPASRFSESANLLKRRWNEVVDSLDEFEIYLANDPQGMITKLVSKNPPKQLDAAVVFREVADSFDTTWRRKGINIESAIVTPLRATVHEGLLRRLLVGPWRASAYFARRGSSVVFSAKSVSGRVIARWEVDGLSIPDEFLLFATDSTLSVNERIERGLIVLASDPTQSPNTLYALISLVTWIDLADACESEFEFKNNNNGFVIELRLK